MCLHVTLCAVFRCRLDSDPGHDNNASWQLRSHWIALGIKVAVAVLLIALSMVLELGRERAWTQPLANCSRAVTATPLILAVAILICAVLEMFCLYPTLMRLIRESRSDLADETATEMDVRGPVSTTADGELTEYGFDARPDQALPEETQDLEEAEQRNESVQ